MNFNKHLTLILLVHDNINFPIRWINYVSFMKVPYKIFIADGGQTDKFNNYIDENFEKLKLDIEFFKYAHEENMSDFYNKSNDIINKVKTPYVLLCSDDDFFIPSGIEKSLKFLNNNNDYSSARGEISGLKFQSYSNEYFTKGYDYEIIYSSVVSSHLQENDHQARLFSQLEDYQLTYYDVHRTKDLQFAYKNLVTLNPKSYILHEIITSGFTILRGKVYRGNFPYLIRDQGPSGITYNEKKKLNYIDWMTKTSWGSDYNSMINAFNTYIKKNYFTREGRHNLHYAHLKFLRKKIIQNLYTNDKKISKMFIYFILNLDLLLDIKKLFIKIIKIYKKKFFKVVVRNGKLIKNKNIVNSNNELKKIIEFLK